MVLGAALLLLVGGPIAWRYRPPNDTERFVVGHWVRVQLPRSAREARELTLSANHRYDLGLDRPGMVVFCVICESDTPGGNASSIEEWGDRAGRMFEANPGSAVP